MIAIKLYIQVLIFQIRTLTDLHGDFCLSIDYLAASAELVVKPDKDIAYCAPVVQKGA